MRRILAFVVVLLGSINALANSYNTSTNAGFLSWNSASPIAYWTPHLPRLAHPGGDPNMWPGTFSSSNLTVTCAPACGIGNAFSIDLSMSNFQSGLGNLNGTVNLLTAPIVLRTQNGIAIAHFNLTGLLTYGTALSLNVDVRGFAKIAYNLNSGQLQISSVSYVLPEPASITLLASGLVFVVARFRASRTREH
jgi:hypothetical protein